MDMFQLFWLAKELSCLLQWPISVLDLSPFNRVFLGKKRSIAVFNTCIGEKMKRSGKTLFYFAFTAKKAAIEPESGVSELAHSSTESREIKEEVVGESDNVPGGGKTIDAGDSDIAVSDVGSDSEVAGTKIESTKLKVFQRDWLRK